MSDIQVLLVETCPSLSHRSTLTFQLGNIEPDGLQLRLIGNTAKGCFANDWVAWSSVEALLPANVDLVSSSLRQLYPGKSINSGGFLLAVLRHLGVVRTNVELGRCYERADVDGFLTRAAGLIAANVSLGLDAKPGSTRGRRKVVPMVPANASELDS